MNFGILIETNEPEKAWNGVRFANASLKAGHAVRIFLMSAGVEIEHITHEKFNVQIQLQEFAQLGGFVFILILADMFGSISGSVAENINFQLVQFDLIQFHYFALSR